MAGTEWTPGQAVAHYTLLDRARQGGMGAVWRAQDTLLGRTVALKTLREITDADPTAFRRLEREARALASINHPNIVTVYSLEEADGQHFLTMEWVEGRPLDEVIPDSGMPLAAFLEMALQIAEAVSVAHACGVIHRDLKPANILVDDRGQVKVLDFGLAKTRRGTGAATSGSTSGDIGGIQGTLHYLAPEQLQENPVDARSDLFSLGVLQYQMLTGIRPFEGRTAIEILSAILLKAPPAIADRRLDLPPALIDLVERCLEKDPGRRIASAKELHDALSDLRGESPRRSQAAPSAAPAPALAVLPLENHTGDPSQDYLADGMTDALITDLARIGSLRVISRTSVLAFRQARRPMSEIAGALGIDAVIEGGVQRSGERLRVTARLIRADTDEHLWSGQFDGDLPDVLDLQSAIAHQIAVEIQARLGRGLISTPGKRRQVDPEVFLLDLQGRHLLTQRTEAAFRLALQRFQEAMRRDPTYAPAFVGLADAFNMLVNYGFLPVEAGLGRARSALQQAAQLGEDNAEIHRVWAHLHWQCEFDWQAAEREYQAGIAFQPDSAILHYWHGVFLGVWGRFEEAQHELRSALVLDPLSLLIVAVQGWVHNFARHYEEALPYYQQALQIDPDFFPARWFRGQAWVEMGRINDGIGELERAFDLGGQTSRSLAYLGYAYGRGGRVAEATAALETLRKRAADSYVPPYFSALIYCGLGDERRALEDLERAVALPDSMARDLKVDPAWDHLRDEPRMAAMLRRLRLA